MSASHAWVRYAEEIIAVHRGITNGSEIVILPPSLHTQLTFPVPPNEMTQISNLFIYIYMYIYRYIHTHVCIYIVQNVQTTKKYIYMLCIYILLRIFKLCNVWIVAFLLLVVAVQLLLSFSFPFFLLLFKGLSPLHSFSFFGFSF